MTHQFDFVASQKGAGLSQYVRARIAMVNNDSSSLVRFSKSSGKQIVVYHSELTILRCLSGTVASFAEETGHHLLRSDFFTNNFRWIWLGFKDPHGGLLIRSHTHRSMIRHL